MENLNEQEYIKDPNQLDLFAGILFTPEQEQKIADFIKSREDIANTNESINKQREQLLINNGFIKGIDFENTLKVKTITREMQLGYTYNKTDFKAEVTFKDVTGYISLKVKKFNSYSAPNELVDYTFSVDFENDKINCSGVQDSYRFIKPSTLLEKLKTFNERQEQLFEEYKKKTDVKQYTVKKYKEKYPNATVTLETEWTKHSGTFDVMKVEFISGSWVKFRLFSNKDKESIYSKYDNEFAKLNTEEILDKFNNQEGSN
jgi:hypothetical protein